MGWFTLGRADTPCEQNTKADRLGMKKYAQALANFVRQCQTPMTVGIQGEWGSGKTSLMNMVSGIIDADNETEVKGRKPREPHIFTHWFQTWQYGAVGDDDSLGFHLMADLIQGMMEHAPKEGFELGSRLRGMVGSLAKAAVIGGAGAVTHGIVDGKALVDGATQAFDGGGPRYQTASGQLDAIKREFQALVDSVVGDDGGRFVIFIDDLDRIRPGRAVMLLEILKNFMDVRNCVFVVACDYDVVREGVKQRLGIDDEDKVGAFFHKIFQVPFQMPVQSYDIHVMLQDFLADKIAQASDRKEPKKADSDRAYELAERLSPMVRVATNTNPRAFKRFLNILDLLSCVAETGAIEEEPKGKRKAKGTKQSQPEPRVSMEKAWLEPQACRSLVGMVALQTRWPAVTAYLSECQTAEQVAALLTTLKDGLTDVDSEEDDDELIGRLQEAYGDDTDPSGFRQQPEVLALCDFAARFFDLLDTEIRDDELTAKEVAWLFSWARQLSVTGVGKRQAPRGGWFEFRNLVRESGGPGAEPYLSVASAIWQGRRKFGKQVQVNRQAKTFYTTIRVGEDSGEKTLLSCQTNLKMRLNAGPVIADELALPQLDALTREFVEASDNAGAPWTLHANERYYKLDFAESPPKGLILDELRSAFRRYLRSVGVAAESPEPLPVETDNADASAAEGVPRTIVVDPPIPLPPSSTQGAAGEDDGDLHQP